MTSPTENAPTRILVVDDHPAIWKTLSLRLSDEDDLQVVATVSSADEALVALQRESADVAVVDLSLSGNGGIDLLLKLRKKHPDLKSLVFSVHNEELYALRVLELGAKGYLMKTAPVEKVVEAIREITSGNIYLSEKMRDQLQGNGDDSSHPTVVLDNMSPAHRAIFEGLGRGDSLETIADELNMSLKAVKYHRRELKNNLSLESNGQLLQYATTWMTGNPGTKT